MAEKLTLVSHHLCPYVQRAAISLAEKEVPFERLAIDLSNKPDWFRRVSPLGKVPLLLVREAGEVTAIFESAVILEFLEETQPKPLHPANPVTRARHRAWIEFGSAILNGIGRFYSAQTLQAFHAESEGLSAMFGRVETELANAGHAGPWFGGDHFSLVEAVYAPVFRYFEVFDGMGDFGVLFDMPRIDAWRAALGARPSVVGAVAPDYAQRLLGFLRARDSVLGSRARALAAEAV